MLAFMTYGEAKHYETLSGTTLDTAVGCTAANLTGPTIEGISKGQLCRAILVTVEGASVNVCIDGTTPTLSAGTNRGHTLTAGMSFMIVGWENVKQTKFLASAAVSGAIVKITYFF